MTDELSKMEPVAWHRGKDWTVHFKLGAERPQNSTIASDEWKPLYAQHGQGLGKS